MIKKSLRAYISGRQLEFPVLTDSKVAGLLAFQLLKQIIHIVLEALVLFPDFHGAQHVDQSGKVLIFYWRFIVDIGDQGCIEQRFRLYPEIVPCASFALGIGNQGRHQFQNILFGVKKVNTACDHPQTVVK